MRCANCGSENPTDSAFCEQCGRRLEQLCPACKAPVSAGARFCRKCGTSLSATSIGSEATATGSPSEAGIRLLAEQTAADVMDGERKTVTALFADIKGSMELLEDLDPEEARAIVDPALKLMINAVHRYGGYIVQSTGDGIFALFGAPVAHEDHPQRALYAAVRLQEEMRRYSARLREVGNLPVEARVGVNTGEVVVRSLTTSDDNVEYTPIGHSTSLAARMQALAPTGSIATTDSTRRLAEGYFVFRGLGPTRVRGASDPVSIYEVTGLGPLRTHFQASARRGLTRFVGRNREMEALRHAVELARTGHGQIVAAMADPGMGKSRLFFEFKAVSQSGSMVLETFSVSHGKASTYQPVIDLLHGHFGIESADDGRKRREKVTGRVVALDRSLEDTLPYLFSLLALVEGDDPLAQMSAQVRKRRILDAIKRILLRESLNQPLIVIFEDLHWIDEQTQDFLNLFADSIATARVLLLVNYRPEYSHKWNSKTYYTQLHLDPLARDSAEEMLDSLLLLPTSSSSSATPRSFVGERKGEGGDLDERLDLIALKRLIIEKTEGTPFFMEEVVHGLIEEGILIRNGNAKLARPLSQIKLPVTVQSLLSSRIDRLPPAEKELLHTLAVLGREFPLGLVQRVTGNPVRRARTDARPPSDRGVHLRATRCRRRQLHLQARIDSGGRVQFAPGRAPQTSSRTRRAIARNHVRHAIGRSSERTGASLQPQPKYPQGSAIPASGGSPGSAPLGKFRSDCAPGHGNRFAPHAARDA